MTPGGASLHAARRERDLAALADGERVDVLVVGGGVTGAGVALDAAGRGLSVALVERRDLAHGSSRWSSKLVHGGLRYLARGDVRLALESARERRLLMETVAPHLVRAAPMLLPLGSGVSHRDAMLVAAGHRAGDLLRFASRTSRRTLPRPRRVTAAEALLLAPALQPAGLRGGLLYWDGQLEDDARLVVALARTAASYGARILTYCTAVEATGEGALVRDDRGGGTLRVRARHVVNATGVWANLLDPGVRLRPSKGSHLVLRAETLGHPAVALTVPIPGGDARFALVLPQPDGLVYLGLTDREHQGPVPDEPVADDDETTFLLEAVAGALARPLGRDDVVGSFAGFRPLLDAAGHTVDLSRRHAVRRTDDGMLTITGGKLTTYRRMAQDVVDQITRRPCRTTRLALVGAGRPRPEDVAGLPSRLVRRYGTEAPAVAALADRDPGLLTPVAPGLAPLGVELLWGVLHEGALTADDLLHRRTRLGMVASDAEAARPVAERLLAATLPLRDRSWT